MRKLKVQPRKRAPGGGRKRAEAEAISSRVPCTTTASEAAAIAQAAERAGMTVSAWTRRAVQRELAQAAGAVEPPPDR